MSDHQLSSSLHRDLLQHFSCCRLCPRHCGVNRLAGETGYCGQTAQLKAARASLHMWEEPCISGAVGSGTVFFSGCNLRCCYCQNHDIALGQTGREITSRRLAEIFLELQQKGAANLNLVTPTHFIPLIIPALQQARSEGLTLPVVYNCGGYEDPEALRLLDGQIDIYLPDLKYCSPELSRKYSHAEDYFERAKAALAEMLRQVGKPIFWDNGAPAGFVPSHAGPDSAIFTDSGAAPVYPADTPLLRRGMIVRHLVLPGQVKDTKKILHYLHDAYGSDIYVSVMCQYTPLPHVTHIPELNRRVTAEEYGRVVDYCLRLGMENVYIQEDGVAEESFIPPFDLSGL